MSLLSVRCKLQPGPSEAESLGRTVDAFAAGCNHALTVAREANTFNKFQLQKLAYHALRERFKLSANLAIRALARVGKRKGRRTGGFKATSVDYDQRILSVNLESEVVSLTTVDGRVKVPLKIGNYQRHLLRTAESIQGGQLVRDNKGGYYIHLWCKYPDTEPGEIGGVLGVDLGIVNLATDSDGHRYSGAGIERNRVKMADLKARLQACGSQSARRHLRKLAGKQARFQRDTNHVISKTIVMNAKRTGRGIKLEDLSGIRDRVKVKRVQRARHHNWAFFQLRSFLEYKAIQAGVPLGLVNPAYTSRECPECGCREKGNRKSQAQFQCLACGYSANADVNAACNIARAEVVRPIVDGVGLFVPWTAHALPVLASPRL